MSGFAGFTEAPRISWMNRPWFEGVFSVCVASTPASQGDLKVKKREKGMER